MKIERATLREFPLSLKEYFEISSGGMQEKRILLLTLEGEGVEGWSECVAERQPAYSYETTDTAWHILTDYLLPGIVGKDFDDPDRVLDPVSWVRGHGMAKAAVEMASWDMLARADGVSLSKKLGGVRTEVPVGVSVGLKPTDEALHEQVAGFIEDGYARVKIKIKPGRDVEMLAGLRDAFPDTSFMADANSAYTLDDIDRLRELDTLDLMMMEQPLRYDDIHHHATLQAAIETPVCLDESIKKDADAELALHLEACRIINIKPGRVGGLSESRRIHDRMRAAGLPVWCGGMLESGIGRAHNVALASLAGFELPGDISASSRYWAQDIVSPEFEVADGVMAVPTAPGIGVEIDTERIASLTTRVASFD
ncbi:MAG: o-succinylbenzoate synthase [Gemmatimonadota bacterium]